MKNDNGVFYDKKFINCGGRLISLETPLVMGVINVTPDSFYDGGKHSSDKDILNSVGRMIEAGVSIIDVGAYSTRPKASDISIEEEKQRLLPAIKLIRSNYPEAVISADTFRASVAADAIKEGAMIINDISCGTMDDTMFETIAQYNVPYIMMHIQGTPQNMQDNPVYKDIVIDIMDYFIPKLDKLKLMGVNDIIIDPGFGFGKSLEQNYELLKKLYLLKMLDCPICCGFSRKSMINKVIGTRPSEALNGTTVLNTLALLQGANILRVHDVKEVIEAIKIVNYYQKA